MLQSILCLFKRHPVPSSPGKVAVLKRAATCLVFAFYSVVPASVSYAQPRVQGCHYRLPLEGSIVTEDELYAKHPKYMNKNYYRILRPDQEYGCIFYVLPNEPEPPPRASESWGEVKE
jgi:hypothetical protein